MALIVVASCTPNGGSIYATIETAKKTVTSSLAKTLTVQDLVNQLTHGCMIAAPDILKELGMELLVKPYDIRQISEVVRKILLAQKGLDFRSK